MGAGGSSAAETNWFRDPSSLMAELQQSGASRSVPANLPGYDHLYQIGHGGQGVVFAAFQRSTRRQVAIKYLKDSAWVGRGPRMRFEREIELAARLRHPNVASVYDSGVASDGSLYCVMEFVDGVPLNQYVAAMRSKEPGGSRGQSKAQEPLLRLFSKICEAVSYAHQRGIIHRDLKPKNILIDDAGRPHVVDFGLAKPTNDGQDEGLTQSGAFVGTLAYAAPEQLGVDGSAVDVRTDVYGLGVILYEMLTGRSPYMTTGAMAQVVREIQEQSPAPPGRFGPIAEDLEAVVLTALAKDPARRYQSVDALHRDVERFLAREAVEAKRDSRWYVLKKAAAANKAAVIVAVVFTAIVLAFGGGMAVLYRQASMARDKESAARLRAEQEGQKSRQSLAFLQQVLASASPSNAGRDVTVRQALDAAASQIATSPAMEPELRVAACMTVGNTYSSLGLYADAAEHLERALHTIEEIRTDDHPDLAAARSNLAAVWASLGRFPEAEGAYRSALETYRRRPDEHAPQIALTLNNLCGLLLQQGNTVAAEPLCREALDINRSRYGAAAHPDVALSLSRLAGVSYTKADYRNAEALFRQSMEMYRRLGGDRQPVIAYCMSNVALALAGQEDNASAEAWHRQALDLRRQLLGDAHPDVGISLFYLADLLSTTNRDEDAERWCRQALMVQENSLPEGHGDLTRTRLLLGSLCLKRGTDSEAEPLFDTAFSAVSAHHGAESDRARQVAYQIANAYEQSGHSAVAKRWRGKVSSMGESKE